MKSLRLAIFYLLANVAQCAHPIHKVLEMLTKMQNGIITQGADVQKRYERFADWCADRSRELHYEIKTQKAQIATLEGGIEQQEDRIVSFDTRIGELSGQLSADEADLNAITLIRKKEKKQFERATHEMADMIGALEKAVTILERQIKEGSSLAQLKSASDVARAFGAMVDANELGSADAQTLTALVQSSAGGKDREDDADSVGAPDPDQAYESKSGSIVETLEGLSDKAQTELDEERSAEQERNSNYELLKQVLETRIKTANEDMDATKKSKAEAGEAKATAQGDLSVTKADVTEDITSLGAVHHKCTSRAEDFQSEAKGRNDELEALAAAKAAIKDVIKDLDFQQTSQDSASSPAPAVSLVQASMTAQSQASRGAPLGVKIVHLLRKRARELQSPVLAQFAKSLDTSIRGATLERRDPLGSVKQLIVDMVKKLEKEASEASDHKAYCDKELAYAGEKLKSKQDDAEGLSTRVNKMNAQASQLKEQLAILQRELLEITRTQAELDKIREEEKAAYKKEKPEMEEAIKATQLAMQVLRDFYDTRDGDTAGGSSGTIIGMLEVVESDFSKSLSDMVAEETASQNTYEDTSKENELQKAAKEQGVKFKTSRSKTLAKSSSELGSDREGMQTEIDASQEYLGRVQQMCLAKPEPYEERKKRREKELQSFREALELLTNAPSLLQGSVSRHLLRGSAASSFS